MQTRSRRILSVVVVGAVALSLLAVLMGSQYAAAQTFTDNNQTQREIHVGGDGTVAAQPDVAIISLGVETMAATAAEAMSQNSQQTQSLIAALTQGGVAQEDIQTQQIQLYPRYQDAQPTPVPAPAEGTQAQSTPEQPRLLGYTATNIVEVRFNDISRVGELLDAVVTAGGNRIQGIRFEISDQSDLLDRAREAAWNDALHKATSLANLAGASLGNVVSIIESSQSPGPVVRQVEMAAAAPIQPGTQNVQVHLEVTWELTGGAPAGRTLQPTSQATGTATPEPTSTATTTEPITSVPTLAPVGTMTPTVTLTATETVTAGETLTGTLPVVPEGTPTPTVESSGALTLTAPTATVSPTLPTLNMEVTPTNVIPLTEGQHEVVVSPPGLQPTPSIPTTLTMPSETINAGGAITSTNAITAIVTPVAPDEGVTGTVTGTSGITGMATPIAIAPITPTEGVIETTPGAIAPISATASMTTTPIVPSESLTSTVISMPSMDISPTVGAAGTQLQVSLTGFPPNASTFVRMGILNATPGVVRSLETDATGALTTTLTIPRFAQPGEQWVVYGRTDEGGGAAAFRLFRVR